MNDYDKQLLAISVVDKQIEVMSLPYDDEMRDKSIRDANLTLDYLEDAIYFNNRELFYQYAKWLCELLEAYMIPTKLMIAHFEMLIDEFKASDIDNREAFIEFIEYSIIRLRGVNIDDKDVKVNKEVELYLEALKNRNVEDAKEIVKRIYINRKSISDVYKQLIVDALHEIGRLWQTRKITVAMEHYMTAMTQNILSPYYQELISNTRNGYSMVATCVGDELHEMGIRMVADIFEESGFDTYYIGANIPIELVLEELTLHKADVLCLSVTISVHLKEAKRLIEEVREKHKDTLIVIGGRGFDLVPELGKRIGADVYEKDPKIACIRAIEMLEEKNES